MQPTPVHRTVQVTPHAWYTCWSGTHDVSTRARGARVRAATGVALSGLRQSLDLLEQVDQLDCSQVPLDRLDRFLANSLEALNTSVWLC